MSELFDDVQRRLIGKQVRLELKLSEKSPTVSVDLTQLEQVLMNLATNARDAMSEGGRLCIDTGFEIVDAVSATKLSLSTDGPHATITVSDDGCGMDEEILSHAFEPFFTTKPAGRGTGLGLSTCAGIIEQCRGRLIVQSKPGQGTSIKIYLPCDADVPDSEPLSTLSGKSGMGESILLIDDDPLVRDTLANMLEVHGISVVHAASGAEALEKSLQSQVSIDLVLCDVGLAGENGAEVVRRIRSSRPGLAVIFMSGHPAESLTWGDSTLERAVFLQKPFSVHDLTLQIRALVGTKPNDPNASKST